MIMGNSASNSQFKLNGPNITSKPLSKRVAVFIDLKLSFPLI